MNQNMHIARWYNADGTVNYAMGWSNWCLGQPDNSDGDNTALGVFAHWALTTNNYCWDDYDGRGDSLSYVCEKDKRKRNTSKHVRRHVKF